VLNEEFKERVFYASLPPAQRKNDAPKNGAPQKLTDQRRL
jgi:hypothetical protein